MYNYRYYYRDVRTANLATLVLLVHYYYVARNVNRYRCCAISTNRHIYASLTDSFRGADAICKLVAKFVY